MATIFTALFRKGVCCYTIAKTAHRPKYISQVGRKSSIKLTARVWFRWLFWEMGPEFPTGKNFRFQNNYIKLYIKTVPKKCIHRV